MQRSDSISDRNIKLLFVFPGIHNSILDTLCGLYGLISEEFYLEGWQILIFRKYFR